MKVNVTNDGMNIEITNKDFEQMFDCDAGAEFMIDDWEAYKRTVASMLMEESCPHTGATPIHLMMSNLNDEIIENDEFVSEI